MESLDLLKNKILTTEEWLTYYKNIWYKNCIARIIDIKSDREIKEKNPETLVTEYDTEYGQPTGKEIPVKERLETRKMLLRDAIKIYKSICNLLEDCENETLDFYDRYLSDNALKVDEDMIVKQPEEKKVEEKPEEEPQA